ncbi:NADH-quinone oxidoreductase subunit L [Campylobacter sp. VicNov18]|uniref:NADH-quinone oxidoreductase subunit L n=1 Tax=Campylobacter bilis TaxID=2691918 RepID=UPI00130EE1A1|nr:NADH-quinone oxidoreductase subunit L [Campylobacter bilis]MPV63819.1 NADH-quinone oxidoreductase subunit L [Campylobacter hepaticus]MBM0637320.1 NADH-quinone oxidoreductase subunit L [Campylobacter bilis]MCC8278039.1 NADH-quinone oxidoreductase subunit L [Campylobacter bilis]MCC8299543.1 NADH-quinone oxidoreductase subunit L [Campylobacter bilis]MCC8300948.1 NADH-quinone oxidoreductase subunit L [Campylobacter bilis]
MQSLALVSLFSPLAAFLFASCFALSKKNLFVAIVCSSLIALSAFCSLYLLFCNEAFNVSLFEWFVGVNFGFDIDAVSLTMMSVVGIVATCVHLYSIFYMAHDEGFNKFFAYLGLFVFSMLFLVMSDNFLGLFVGWEGVGLCSWLLIGFWYKNNTYSFAANEAFIMNRIADLGMLLGIFWLYLQAQTLKYDEVFAMAQSLDHNALILIASCLFIGAMGKSAQFPFHTWLADAMTGPTPVSALIHAATMVTAGVYLLIRAGTIYDLVPEVSYGIALLGSFVAIFAASMALVARDLKRIIAYSTLSQLGYMFVAAGLGAYSIALFHLITHAFFKSLLFLGAGNVMHAMDNELDIKKMGGLFKSLKFTAIFMSIGSLALTGIYPFAGFFSKDLILGYSFISFHHGIFLVLLVAAFLTAFYSFRVLMLVFFVAKKHDKHPHEASKIALLAMSPLVILSIIMGFFEHTFFEYLSTQLVFIDAQNQIVMICASIAAVLGVVLAIFAYKNSWFKDDIEKNKIHKLLSNDYFIPKFYHQFIVARYENLCMLLKYCDIYIFDRVVEKIACYSQSISQKMILTNHLNLMLRFLVAAFVVLLILVWMV